MGNAAQHVRAKGGGLGDVSAGLIRHLHNEGRFALHVALPKYERKLQDYARVGRSKIDRLSRILQRRGVHLVSDSAFAGLSEVYGDSHHPRIHRANAFQRHVINQLLDAVNPDIVHCNDWMTGLIPAAAAERDIRSLFTLHNVFTEYSTPQQIDYQGIDVGRFLERLYFQGFPTDPHDTWHRNQVDFTASGLFAADLVNTVSPTFLEEILAGEHNAFTPPSVVHCLRTKSEAGTAFGILNAPDDVADPRYCRGITPYDIENVEEMKAANKAALQKRTGLPLDPSSPIFLWVNRLFDQKSPDVLLAVARDFVRYNGGQILLVANGDRKYETAFAALRAPTRNRVMRIPFTEELARLGQAGADFVLMPSRYEPCGLPQMEGCRFGTLPIVRTTGGLKDSIQELDVDTGTGNGFRFDTLSPRELRSAMNRAMMWYENDPRLREETRQRVMRESRTRFSLAATARSYMELYDRLSPTSLRSQPRNESEV